MVEASRLVLYALRSGAAAEPVEVPPLGAVPAEFPIVMESWMLLVSVGVTLPALVRNRNPMFRVLSRLWTVAVTLVLLCGRNLVSRRSMAIVDLKLVNTEVNLSLTKFELTTINCRGTLLTLTRLASAHMLGAAWTLGTLGTRGAVLAPTKTPLVAMAIGLLVAVTLVSRGLTN